MIEPSFSRGDPSKTTDADGTLEENVSNIYSVSVNTTTDLLR